MEKEVEIIKRQNAVLFDLIEELVSILREDPELLSKLATNTKLNDFYMIRKGAK